ncbi:MAG: Gldg family protein [Candidatus Krumholzibacteriia bacterium]
MNSKRRNFRLTFAVATVLLAAIAFFLISVTGNMQGARADLTSDRLFTLSDPAVKILQSLKVPVQVKLYITPADKMPTQLRNLERDITEQMRNFEQVSDGMLQFAVYNPQDDEQMQQALTGKGISPFQVQSIEKDEMGIKLIWSAITIAYKDKPEEVLPRVLPQNLAALEQDIIGPVYRLTREKTPRVAVVAPRKAVDQQLAMMYLQQGMQPPEPQDQYTQLSELLRNGHYEAVPVQLTEDDPLPEDVDCLIVMAVTGLNERQVYEIGRALRRGVPVVMGVQAHEYNYSPGRSGGWSLSGIETATGLEPMLAELGLDLGEDHFFDANMETIDLPREVNLGGLRMQTREPVKVPMQIRVTEDQMLQDSPLVNRIGSLFYLWGTPVTVDVEQMAAHGLQAVNLIESSPNCWTMGFDTAPLPGSALDPAGKTMLGPQPLAVLVSGQFPDLYEGKEVPAWPEAAPPAEDAAEEPAGPEAPAEITPAPAQLLVIGSAKMFDDNIISAPQNALLLLNAVDFMAGSHDLLEIRAKTLTQRVIRAVEAGEKMAWRLFVVLVVPVVLAAYGIIRAGMRRKDAARYSEALRRAGGAH